MRRERDEEFGERVAAVVSAVDQLRATLSHSTLAVALQGAEVRQVRTGGASTLAATSPNRLLGWSLRETASSNATVYLRDGVDTLGEVVAAIQLGPHESTRDSYFPGGLSLIRGLYVDVTGSVEGAVFLGGAA